MAKERPQHAGREHSPLRPCRHGKIEQLARAAQAGIAEGGDDGPRRFRRVSSRQHLPSTATAPTAASARVAM